MEIAYIFYVYKIFRMAVKQDIVYYLLKLSRQYVKRCKCGYC